MRRSYTELPELFGNPEELRPVVQRMAPRGVDTIVRAVIDPAAGAALSFGIAGPPSQLLGDMAHRLRSEEHTSELQSRENLVCRLLLEKKKKRPSSGD